MILKVQVFRKRLFPNVGKLQYSMIGIKMRLHFKLKRYVLNYYVDTYHLILLRDNILHKSKCYFAFKELFICEKIRLFSYDQNTNRCNVIELLYRCHRFHQNNYYNLFKSVHLSQQSPCCSLCLRKQRMSM